VAKDGRFSVHSAASRDRTWIEKGEIEIKGDRATFRPCLPEFARQWKHFDASVELIRRDERWLIVPLLRWAGPGGAADDYGFLRGMTRVHQQAAGNIGREGYDLERVLGELSEGMRKEAAKAQQAGKAGAASGR